MHGIFHDLNMIYIMDLYYAFIDFYVYGLREINNYLNYFYETIMIKPIYILLKVMNHWIFVMKF